MILWKLVFLYFHLFWRAQVCLMKKACKTWRSIFNHMRRLACRHVYLAWLALHMRFSDGTFFFYLACSVSARSRRNETLDPNLHLGGLRQSTPVHNWIFKMRSRLLTLLEPSYSYKAPSHNPLGEGAQETGTKSVTVSNTEQHPPCSILCQLG